MKLELLGVVNGGDADKEYVRIKVLESVDAKGYAIVDETFKANDKPSNEFRHIFLFPSKALTKGDYIRVFTGEGDYQRVKNDGGTTTHKFYWNSDSAVWNDKEGDTARLIHYTVVGTCKVPPKGIVVKPKPKPKPKQ